VEPLGETTSAGGPAAAFEQVVRGNQYMVLATSDRTGVPWATPVWFASEDLHAYYWVSRPEARHSTNLAVRRELGITIFDSHQPPGTGVGVYLDAVGAPVLAADLERGITIFSAALVRTGASPWSRTDVTGDAQHRLYRAIARERFVLDSRDRRIRLPDS